MRTFEDIRAAIDGHSIIRGAEKLPNGHVRMETSFLYPDGGSIDVFVPAEDGPLLALAPKLTDFGQTTSWLSDVQVKPWLSKKRQRLLEDAIRVLGVRQDGGALELDLPDGNQIIDGVVRLGQACIRVADLAYTRRTSLQASVIEEVEEILADSELDYEENAELDGKYGKVRVDFLVHGRRTDSALLTLSAANSSTAHAVANEIFKRWYDLDAPSRTEQRVTLFDDRHDTYKTEDLKRLADVSQVVQLSDRKAVADLLAA